MNINSYGCLDAGRWMIIYNDVSRYPDLSVNGSLHMYGNTFKLMITLTYIDVTNRICIYHFSHLSYIFSSLGNNCTFYI